MTSLPPSATRVLDEVRAAGLDLAHVPGSAAKIRLILDLRADLGERDTLRVLDVGCGGLSQPLNVWEPLVPFAERLDVHGSTSTISSRRGGGRRSSASRWRSGRRVCST